MSTFTENWAPNIACGLYLLVALLAGQPGHRLAVRAPDISTQCRRPEDYRRAPTAVSWISGTARHIRRQLSYNAKSRRGVRGGLGGPPLPGCITRL